MCSGQPGLFRPFQLPDEGDAECSGQRKDKEAGKVACVVLENRKDTNRSANIILS